MSFAEVLNELPTLTVSERQLLIRRVLELEDPGLSTSEQALVEARLAGHRENPSSSVPLQEMRGARIRPTRDRGRSASRRPT